MRRLAYIAGPMTGRPNFNFGAFFAAQELLERRGVSVINPAALNPPHRPWWACMLVCLWHLRLADEVRLLPGWERSRGARLEVAAAVVLGLRIYPAIGSGPCTCIEVDYAS
jgi:hypothetical protein